MNKGIKFLLAGAAVALLSVPAFAADTIKIGVAGAHSGDLASYGMASLNATRLVVEEVNAKGGILGKQLEIVAQDDQCKPEMGTNAATKLISEKVNVVLGHICSGATKAALPIYKEAKLIAISPSATTPDLTMSGQNPYFFRTVSKDDDQGTLGARFIVEKLKAKKVAILHDNADYGKGYAEYVKAGLEKSGQAKIVLFEAITPDAVDFSAAVLKLKRAGADVLVFGGYHPTASKLVQQMRRKGLKTPVLGPDGIKVEDFIKMAGKEAEGVYASYPRDTSKLPLYIKAQTDHQKKYGTEPGPFYYNAYSAVLALINAMDKAGTAADTDKIVQALRTHFVDTPCGKIKFDNKGDGVGIGLSVYQVQKGKYVELDYGF